MIKNYFKIVFRTILNNKLSYFLNILGLTVGISTFILIFFYVDHEFNYDTFHENSDQIYRITLSQIQGGEVKSNSAENYPAVGPALQEYLPEVRSYTRLYNAGSKNNVVFTSKEQNDKQGYKVRKFLYADSSFFSIFSFPLLSGDRKTCLSNANSAVISESFAKKMFGDVNPIGKTIEMMDDDFNQEYCKVTAVFKDVPFNSHLKFDILLSYANLLKRGARAQERYHSTWQRKDMYTYVLLSKEAKAEELEVKMADLVERYYPGLELLNREVKLGLQPLSTIHLNSHLDDELEKNNYRQHIFTMILAGFLILVIAMVNFLNYTVARSMTRAKDFGLRKIFGAGRKDLILQFVFESLFLNLIAICLAIGLIVLLFPYYKNLTNLETSSVFSFLFSPSFFFAIFIGLVAGIGFGGILPAFILNQYNLNAVVKGKLLTYGSGLTLRRGLTIFQISASIALTIICFIVLGQLNFVTGFDLGIDVSNSFAVDRPGKNTVGFEDLPQKYDLFKSRLLNDPSVQSVTGSTVIPGKKNRLRSSIRNFGEHLREAHQIDVAVIDESFFSTMNLDLLAGQPFMKERAIYADSNIILSLKATQSLGFDNPAEIIGKKVTLDRFNDWSPSVVGVVEDFYQVSLKEAAQPTAFAYNNFVSEYFLIKVNPKQTAHALSHIEKIWNMVYPGNPFQYYYLQDFINKQYFSEQLMSSYMVILAILSIIISGIGLFNISLFTMVQRTKEIGVRKTIGASTFQIGWLLIKEYLLLILIGSGIAIPFAYFFGVFWLDSFVHKVPLSAWSFLVAVSIVLLISIATISFYTIKATKIDPVVAIKNEV